MAASVVIIMGSNSDSEKMLPAIEVFRKLSIDYAIRIASAHRTPEYLDEVVREMEKAGCKVFICAAGMAAHLAGAVAAKTIKPVIGVPLTSKASPLSGMDALLSTVQMPSGMPVATVAIDGAKNAAWLAAQILAIKDRDLADNILLERKYSEIKVWDEDKELQKKLAEIRPKGGKHE